MQFSLVALLATAAVVSATTYSTVSADVTTIDKDATALNKLVQAADGSDLDADLTINTAAQLLNTDIIKATNDTKALSKALTSTQAKAIIKILTTTEKTAAALCKQLVSARKGYQKAGVTTFVYADVRNIAVNVDALGTALVAAVPSSSATSAKSLASKFNADIKVCTDEYINY